MGLYVVSVNYTKRKTHSFVRDLFDEDSSEKSDPTKRQRNTSTTYLRIGAHYSVWCRQRVECSISRRPVTTFLNFYSLFTDRVKIDIVIIHILQVGSFSIFRGSLPRILNENEKRE